MFPLIDIGEESITYTNDNWIIFLTQVHLMKSLITFGNQETLIDKDRISDAKQCAHLLNK